MSINIDKPIHRAYLKDQLRHFEKYALWNLEDRNGTDVLIPKYYKLTDWKPLTKYWIGECVIYDDSVYEVIEDIDDQQSDFPVDSCKLLGGENHFVYVNELEIESTMTDWNSLAPSKIGQIYLIKTEDDKSVKIGEETYKTNDFIVVMNNVDVDESGVPTDNVKVAKVGSSSESFIIVNKLPTPEEGIVEAAIYEWKTNEQKDIRYFKLSDDEVAAGSYIDTSAIHIKGAMVQDYEFIDVALNVDAVVTEIGATEIAEADGDANSFVWYTKKGEKFAQDFATFVKEPIIELYAYDTITARWNKFYPIEQEDIIDNENSSFELDETGEKDKLSLIIKNFQDKELLNKEVEIDKVIIKVNELPVADVNEARIYKLTTDTADYDAGLYYAVKDGGNIVWTKVSKDAYILKATNSITLDGVVYPTLQGNINFAGRCYNHFNKGEVVLVTYDNVNYYKVISAEKFAGTPTARVHVEYICGKWLIKTGTTNFAGTFEEHYDLTAPDALISVDELPTTDIKDNCFYRLKAKTIYNDKGVYYAVKNADNTYTWTRICEDDAIIEVTALPTENIKDISFYRLTSDTSTHKKGVYYAVDTASGFEWYRLEESAYIYKASAFITIDGADYPTVTATVGDPYNVHKEFTEGKRVVIEHDGKYYDVINCVKSGDDYWCEYIAEHYLIKSGNHGNDTFKEYFDITQGISGNVIYLSDKTGTLTDDQFAVLTAYGDKTIINSTASSAGNKVFNCTLKTSDAYYFARTICLESNGKVYTETYTINTDTKEYTYLSYAVGQTPMIDLGAQADSGTLTNEQRDILLTNNEHTIVKLGTYYYHVFRMWTSSGSHRYNFRSLSTTTDGIPSVYVLNIDAEGKTWTWREDEMSGDSDWPVIDLGTTYLDSGTLTQAQIDLIKTDNPRLRIKMGISWFYLREKADNGKAYYFQNDFGIQHRAMAINITTKTFTMLNYRHQTQEDATLQTTSQFIAGAINEVNDKIPVIKSGHITLTSKDTSKYTISYENSYQIGKLCFYSCMIKFVNAVPALTLQTVASIKGAKPITDTTGNIWYTRSGSSADYFNANCGVNRTGDVFVHLSANQKFNAGDTTYINFVFMAA